MQVNAVLPQVGAYRTGLTCHTIEVVHFAMASSIDDASRRTYDLTGSGPSKRRLPGPVDLVGTRVVSEDHLDLPLGTVDFHLTRKALALLRPRDPRRHCT